MPALQVTINQNPQEIRLMQSIPPQHLRLRLVTVNWGRPKIKLAAPVAINGVLYHKVADDETGYQAGCLLSLGGLTIASKDLTCFAPHAGDTPYLYLPRPAADISSINASLARQYWLQATNKILWDGMMKPKTVDPEDPTGPLLDGKGDWDGSHPSLDDTSSVTKDGEKAVWGDPQAYPFGNSVGYIITNDGPNGNGRVVFSSSNIVARSQFQVNPPFDASWQWIASAPVTVGATTTWTLQYLQYVQGGGTGSNWNWATILQNGDELTIPFPVAPGNSNDVAVTFTLTNVSGNTLLQATAPTADMSQAPTHGNVWRSAEDWSCTRSQTIGLPTMSDYFSVGGFWQPFAPLPSVAPHQVNHYDNSGGYIEFTTPFKDEYLTPGTVLGNWEFTTYLPDVNPGNGVGPAGDPHYESTTDQLVVLPMNIGFDPGDILRTFNLTVYKDDGHTLQEFGAEGNKCGCMEIVLTFEYDTLQSVYTHG